MSRTKSINLSSIYWFCGHEGATKVRNMLDGPDMENHPEILGNSNVKCVRLFVGHSVSRITQKTTDWFPPAFNGGWVSAQNRPHHFGCRSRYRNGSGIYFYFFSCPCQSGPRSDALCALLVLINRSLYTLNAKNRPYLDALKRSALVHLGRVQVHFAS